LFIGIGIIIARTTRTAGIMARIILIDVVIMAVGIAWRIITVISRASRAPITPIVSTSITTAARAAPYPISSLGLITVTAIFIIPTRAIVAFFFFPFSIPAGIIPINILVITRISIVRSTSRNAGTTRTFSRIA